MDRAKYILLTTAQRQSKERRVINDLNASGCPKNFKESVWSTKQPTTKALGEPKSICVNSIC